MPNDAHQPSSPRLLSTAEKLGICRHEPICAGSGCGITKPKGGRINLGRKFSMANEHNWALATPELFAQTVRAWIEGKTLPREIGNLK